MFYSLIRASYYCVRANTLSSYFEINKELLKVGYGPSVAKISSPSLPAQDAAASNRSIDYVIYFVAVFIFYACLIT